MIFVLVKEIEFNWFILLWVVSLFPVPFLRQFSTCTAVFFTYLYHGSRFQRSQSILAAKGKCYKKLKPASTFNYYFINFKTT